jgi:pimeloyl-ACP methyl ester carboxylesterase
MLRPDIAISMLGSMLHYDAAKRMEGVSVPIRCINSSALAPTNVEAARKHAKSFDLLTIDKVGHYPMLEAPAEFDKLLDEAISGHPAKVEKHAPAQD